MADAAPRRPGFDRGCELGAAAASMAGDLTGVGLIAPSGLV
jgi:hypothetical protein